MVTKAVGFIRNIALHGRAQSPVLVGSCLIPLLVISAAAIKPALTSSFLARAGDFYLANFPHWIVWSVSLFLTFSVVLALLPNLAKRKLGTETDCTNYSFFSWFSMIFGTGMAVGLLTWGIAEPMAGMQNNPDVIRGLVSAETTGNISSALKWSYAHWGFAGWAAYALIGLAVAYTGYRQRLPLTIRTGLTPLFGNLMKGLLGHLVDVLTIVATLFGIAQVLGYALDESVIALAQITHADWLIDNQGNASVVAKIAASATVMLLAAISAISGIARGVKWFSNANMLVSLSVLLVIFLAGPIKDGWMNLISSLSDYLINLPIMMFQVWTKDGTDVGDSLQAWQGTWSMYHWTGWWLAFSPFVGLFLARISKGRTIGQYLFATIFLPALLTIVWMSWVGGNAISLELSGAANQAIVSAETGLKIFTLMQLMFDSWGSWLMSVAMFFLLISYLTTTIDSAIIVSVSVLSEEPHSGDNGSAILIWSVILTAAMTFLILIDGFSSIRSSMVLASAPISVVIMALCLSLILAIWRDSDSRST